MALAALSASACVTPAATEDAGHHVTTGDDAGAGTVGSDGGGDGDGDGDADGGSEGPADGGSLTDAGDLGDDGDAGGDDAGSPSTDAGDDAGSPSDAGVDNDAGRIDDGGSSVDAGASDSGTPDDDGGTDGGTPYVAPSRAVCAGSYTVPPVNAGDLGDPELVETSGLAASLLNPGVLYAHNDSGDSARIFALGTDGRALGQIALTGATFVDAEDIATAPCPDLSGPCIYLADTGDNAKTASEVSLFIIPEPVVDPVTGVGMSSTSDYQRVRFVYSGGPVDVEAMAVEPDGSRVYFFEKLHADSVRAFALEAPFPSDGVATAEVLTTFAPPGLDFVNYGRSITAADLHLSGTRLLVRVYSGVYEYRFGAGQGVADLGSVNASLITLGPFSETQGEALAYGETGRELFSVSEDTQQMPGQPLHRFPCP